MRARGIALAFARPILKVVREADGYALQLADDSVERGYDELIWAPVQPRAWENVEPDTKPG